MRDVYRTADRVVAWIGDESEDSNRAMMFLKEMAMAKKRLSRCSGINGVRQGSDTSSECGDGTQERAQTLEEEGQESDGEEGEDSESGSVSSTSVDRVVRCTSHAPMWKCQIRKGGGIREQVANSCGQEETPGQSDLETGEDPSRDQPVEEPIPEVRFSPDDQSAVDSEQELVEQDSEEECAKKEDRKKRWDAYIEDRNQNLERRWDAFIEESQQNQERHGHLVTGVPILYCAYESPYIDFFNESRVEDWIVIDKLLERPWWSRTWVVQEVWLSTDAILQCGGTTLKWKTVQKAMDYSEAWDDMGYHVQNTPRIKSWSTLKRRYGLAIHIAKQRLLGSSHLSDLLWNTWDREATDPRDKVFAVLGLLQPGADGVHPPPTADYSKPVDQVYREAAAYIINSKASLDILLAASGLDGEESNLPSWVPNWRRTGNDHRAALFINGSRMQPLLYFSGSTDAVFLNGHGYCASGGSKAEARFSHDLRTVHVRGFLFDTIADIGPLHDASCSITDIMEGAGSVLARLSSNGVEQTEVAEEELTKILRGGSYTGGRNDFFRSEDQVVQNIMSKRRFFVTKTGHLCIGPARTEVGDSVYYMAGCNFPMVFRSKGDHLRLVGEAYGELPPLVLGPVLGGDGSGVCLLTVLF